MASTSIKPVYVLHGGDAFLLDAHRREIVASIIGDADPQICLSAYDATAALSDVLDDLRTAPFLAPRRVVIVRDADTFVSAHRPLLEKYLESPAQTGSLVLMVSSWRKDTRLAKRVAAIGQAFDCASPDEGKLGQWLGRAAAKRGKKLDAEAAELLAAWVGNDLALLNSEMEKLSLYVGDRPTIGAEDIAATVTASAGPAAFALTNAVTSGNAAEALQALSGMLAGRGDEFKTLGLLGWHLRKTLKARRLLDAGQSMEKALPYMPYRQKSAFAAMLQRRGLAEIEKDFRRLIAADLAMKTGAEPVSAMQQLVVGLCS